MRNVLPVLTILGCLFQWLPASAMAGDTGRDALTEFGRALFFDADLSEPRGQSCATCHDPDRAFTDGRESGTGGALSLGADGHSLGDRNTPTLTYAAFIPAFQNIDGHPTGGLFLDGRAATLARQAVEPMLNPLEMAQPDRQALVERILENADHRLTIEDIFGAEALASEESVVNAVTTAIAAFERSETFTRFDSRYDRSLVGDYEMTREEAIGRDLFFSDLINCIQCHLNDPSRVSRQETFTNHRYHNIGTPVNVRARQANGLGTEHRDPGLADNPEHGQESAGRFRVPTLRNVAVTAPYMHNGAFATLEAAVAFYAHYPLPNAVSRINPETGEPWRAAEVPETVDLELLEGGQPIDPERVAYLVAFLRTLTDRRYESLLDPAPARSSPSSPKPTAAAPTATKPFR
jgi:cytochrome c peroxidase